MDNLTFYTERLTGFQAAAESQRELLRQNPDDVGAQFFAEAYEVYVSDAKHECNLAQAEQLQELFEVRLFGEEVSDGTIRLDTLAKLAGPLSATFKHAAHRLHFGKVARHKVDKSISALLDLRLGALAYGSTKLYITGNVHPDLTGQSLLQQTLLQIFKLLTVKSEDFYDAVDAVGLKSARKLDEMLATMQAHGMAAEWHWDSPGNKYSWDGSTDEILRVKSLLETITEPESYVENLTGEISGIHDVGRLELRTNEGKVKIRFALQQTSMVLDLHLHQAVNLKVETNRYFDSLSKSYVFKHFLLERM
ncbi:hypothetical protein [Glaciimonas sp. PAMC28666]|uniref:hypothetical protein n=1 Tax=Glaciimonas sp. PAMC28666 TaxID=2807626 RepID=UPI0019664856|nr:hypothetical protein [Glaciimonas sp. PAMC28666]QRX83251.1 hypothetical protein JQN73_02945 [Glaciimonas sp. PAMC28666]